MDVTYSGKYFNGSREELIQKVQARLSERRFKHSLGVEFAALKLAEQNGIELELASIAALTHDYAKERSDQEFIEVIQNEDFDKELLNWSNAIWHGVVGTYFIQKELGITNTEILQAIAVHTTGSKQMTMLDKIIYVADYIEPGRKFPGVDEARRLAEINIDEAVRFETSGTLAHLIQTSAPIYPKTIETYNRYVAHKL